MGGAVGDYAGGKIADAAGMRGSEKQVVATGSGIAGAAGGGAVVGALFAGPAGAAAGAVIGAGGQVVSNSIGAVVDVCFQDARHDFGPGVGMRCNACRKFCQNRGCKACKKNFCEECFEGHMKRSHGKQ